MSTAAEEEGKVGDELFEVVVGVSTAVCRRNVVVRRRVESPVVGFAPCDEHFKVEDSSADEVPAIVVRFFFFL